MSTPEDRPTLFAAARDGDRQALAELLAAYGPQLQAFVRLRMGAALRRREESLDLVQTVCAALAERLDAGTFRLRTEPEFRAWLFQAALTKLREHARFHQRERRRPQREVDAATRDGLVAAYATLSTPSRLVSAEEQVERVEAALEELPEDYRDVIVWARIVGLPHADIAARMERSVGAVRQLLGRALVRLDRILHDDEDAADHSARRP